MSINLPYIFINNVQNLKVYVHFYRTMVGAIDIGMYFCVDKTFRPLPDGGRTQTFLSAPKV